MLCLHSLQVNSARALLFIQSIASDFSLGINDYYKLQRFTNRIWSSSGADEGMGLAALTATDEFGGAVEGGGLPAGGTFSANRKSSKERLRERRSTTSLGSMLSMQGDRAGDMFNGKPLIIGLPSSATTIDNTLPHEHPALIPENHFETNAGLNTFEIADSTFSADDYHRGAIQHQLTVDSDVDQSQC